MAWLLNRSQSVPISEALGAPPLHSPMVFAAVIDAGVAMAKAATTSRLIALASRDTARAIATASGNAFRRLLGSVELKVGLVGGRHWRAPLLVDEPVVLLDGDSVFDPIAFVLAVKATDVPNLDRKQRGSTARGETPEIQGKIVREKFVSPCRCPPLRLPEDTDLMNRRKVALRAVLVCAYDKIWHRTNVAVGKESSIDSDHN